MFRYFGRVCLALVFLGFPVSASANSLKDFEFAKVLLSEGEYAAAMNFFGLAISDGALTSAQLATAYHLRGISRSRLEKHRLALRDHKKAVLLKPDYVAAWSSICYQHMAITKEYDTALEACETALKLNPRHAPSYALRANVWQGKGQADKAEADFSQSIQLDPKNWQAYFDQGLFFHNNKRRDDAKKSLAKAHSLAPRWSQARMAAMPVFQTYGIAK